MAKILVGYERGENLGHYKRLAPVAEALGVQLPVPPPGLPGPEAQGPSR